MQDNKKSDPIGQVSQRISKMHLKPVTLFTAEHPYNISFITNDKVIKFFKPFNLLSNKKS